MRTFLYYSENIIAAIKKIEENLSPYEAICTRLNLLAKPMKIINVDKTGISVEQKSGKVVTGLG